MRIARNTPVYGSRIEERMVMNTIAVGRASSPGIILRANAFRLIIREMGNGVDRIDGAICLPRDEAVAGACLDGAERLPHPLRGRLLDLVLRGAGMIGVAAGDLARPLIGGYARPLADGRLEVTAWDAGTG
jgi:hypothetical protein